MEELTTQAKGKITELKVASYFLEKGFIISLPIVDTRYDFLLDYQGKILKIQVKTAHLIEDRTAIEFKTCNTHINTQGIENRNYKGEIDYFATFYQNKCYLVPVDICGSRTRRLRLIPPKNNNMTGVCMAVDYELEKILK
jgi:hypothetical protein